MPPVSIPLENVSSSAEVNTYDIPRPIEAEQTSPSIEKISVEEEVSIFSHSSFHTPDK